MVPKLRVNRARATFWNNGPKIGIFSNAGCTLERTASSFLCFPHQMLKATITTRRSGPSHFIMLDKWTRICVAQGRLPPRSLNICSKIGTMNSSMPTTARIAMANTITGYVIADLI